MINVYSKLWDRSKSRWVKDLHSILGNGRIMILQDGEKWNEYEAGKRFLISNYSGIKDSGGKMVFDGNIIQFTNKERKRVITAPVVFANGGFLIWTPNENPAMCLLGDLKESKVRFEVVGNVFENGKMLNKWSKE